MKFKNPVSVVSPVDGGHAANKDYVDDKMVTKTWAEYQALSEEEKNNGTLYDIPDMPTAGQGGIITTYTHVSQLGLSNGCSVGDVFNALPNNSLAEIACQMQDYADDTTVSYITDLPSPHVLLIIRKHIANSTIRFDITAKLSARDSVTNNFMWIGQLKGSDGTGVTWQRVCTTSVPDVRYTDISNKMLPTVLSGGTLGYSIINGICYLEFNNITVKKDSMECLSEAILPKACPGTSTNSVPFWYGGYNCLFTAESGMLKLWCSSEALSSGNTTIHHTISYPVADDWRP